MDNVQFGWVAPVQAGSGVDGAQFVNQLVGWLEQIRDEYDSAWFADHFHPAAANSGSEHAVLECLTTISYLASRFPNLRFGSFVLGQAYRNPALVAKIGATLQLLTGGRFVLGVGAGWKEDEFRAYDYDFPQASVRIAQLAEAVQIIRQMWTVSPATFEGQYYQVQKAYCEPRPSPRPPIMIGGGGEKRTLRTVARYADASNVQGTPDDVAHKFSVLDQHCKDVGRDPSSIRRTIQAVLFLTEDEALQQRVIQGMKALRDVSDEDARKMVLMGSPAEVIDQIKAYEAVGVQEIMVAQFPAVHRKSLLRFSEEVIPAFR